MGSCNKLGTFLQCSLSDICEASAIDTKKCMYGLSQKIGEEQTRKLKTDCNERGLYIRGIEDTFASLNRERGNVDVWDAELGHLSKPWGKITAKSPIIPLDCETKAKSGDLRPSEFGCPIARILSKTDLDRVQELFNIVIDHSLAEIGTTRHALCLNQHTKEFEHAKYAGLPPRKKYCEKRSVYIFESKLLHREIIIPGRADCLFTFDDSHAIGIIDLKRSRHFYYIKNSHQRQTLIYGLGVAQHLDYDTIYTIVLEGPFKPEPFKFRYPQKHIAKFRLDSPKVTELHEGLVETYTEQSRVLDELAYFESVKDKKSNAKNGCMKIDASGKMYECFDKPACDALCNYCSQSKRSLRDVIDDFKLVRKGYRLPQL